MGLTFLGLLEVALTDHVVRSRCSQIKAAGRGRDGRVLVGGLELLSTLVKQYVGFIRYDVLGVDRPHCIIIEAVPGAGSSLAVSSVVPPSWVALVICHSIQIIYWGCHLQSNQQYVTLKQGNPWWFHESSSPLTVRTNFASEVHYLSVQSLLVIQ